MNKSLWIGMTAGAAIAAGAGAVAGLKIMNKAPQYADVVQVTPQIGRASWRGRV